MDDLATPLYVDERPPLPVVIGVTALATAAALGVAAVVAIDALWRKATGIGRAPWSIR